MVGVRAGPRDGGGTHGACACAVTRRGGAGKRRLCRLGARSTEYGASARGGRGSRVTWTRQGRPGYTAAHLPLTAWSRPYGRGSGGQEVRGRASVPVGVITPSCIAGRGVAGQALASRGGGFLDGMRGRAGALVTGGGPAPECPAADQPCFPRPYGRRPPRPVSARRRSAASSGHASGPPPAPSAPSRRAGVRQGFRRPKAARSIPGGNAQRPYRTPAGGAGGAGGAGEAGGTSGPAVGRRGRAARTDTSSGTGLRPRGYRYWLGPGRARGYGPTGTGSGRAGRGATGLPVLARAGREATGTGSGRTWARRTTVHARGPGTRDASRALHGTPRFQAAGPSGRHPPVIAPPYRRPPRRQPSRPPRAITSAYQRALSFAVRRWDAKSTCTMPNRLP